MISHSVWCHRMWGHTPNNITKCDATECHRHLLVKNSMVSQCVTHIAWCHMKDHSWYNNVTMNIMIIIPTSIKTANFYIHDFGQIINYDIILYTLGGGGGGGIYTRNLIFKIWHNQQLANINTYFCGIFTKTMTFQI